MTWYHLLVRRGLGREAGRAAETPMPGLNSRQQSPALRQDRHDEEAGCWREMFRQSLVIYWLCGTPGYDRVSNLVHAPR